jgi:hypothetical protein
MTNLQAYIHDHYLHIGSTTRQLVLLYINCIQVLRDLDPSGVLLSDATAGLRKYLRARKDAIKTILTFLFDPKMDLYQYLDGDEIVVAADEEVVTVQENLDFTDIWHPSFYGNGTFPRRAALNTYCQTLTLICISQSRITR